jgi:hypothetical protein
MGTCSDCYLPTGTPEEIASSPDMPWCECPILKTEPYVDDEDEDSEDQSWTS